MNKKMTIVSKLDNYILLQSTEGDKFIYRVFETTDYSRSKVAWATKKENLEEMTQQERSRSKVYGMFTKWVEDNRPKYKQMSFWDDEDEEEDVDVAYPSSMGINRGYYYKPQPYTKNLKDNLMKSNTLVIHCKDRTTEMLCQVYEGKGWDVLRDGNIDPEELHELIRNHERIVMLGHGTPAGLINVQRGGLIIDSSFKEDLKDKTLFVIWCRADEFFRRIGVGKGQFITGNIPSEVWECRAAGCGEISAELMLENITYGSKLCADVVEKA